VTADSHRRSDRPRLAESSYAILGHLALRPWSAYELTQSVRRSLRWFWSRADSRIYSEARRLVALELAEARSEGPESRPRTVYSITPAGRLALAEWLATPSTRFLMHFEPLLRVHLASHGTKADLVRAVDDARATAAEIERVGAGVAADYLAGRHPLQAEAHVRALVFDFLWSLRGLIADWAHRTEQEVGTWDDLVPTDEMLARGVALMREALDALEARPGE
jgi:PadR family transcriptional regulator, regulatory protein AphA